MQLSVSYKELLCNVRTLFPCTRAIHSNVCNLGEHSEGLHGNAREMPRPVPVTRALGIAKMRRRHLIGFSKLSEHQASAKLFPSRLTPVMTSQPVEDAHRGGLKKSWHLEKSLYYLYYYLSSWGSRRLRDLEDPIFFRF